MTDRPSDVESRLRQLDEIVASLCRRLDLLEHRDDSPPAASVVAAAAPPTRSFAATVAIDAFGWISLAGRLLVILGGAFLLRALTESDRLPDTAGVALGLLYMLVWLGLAEYATSARPETRATHGLAALLVGLPLLWEASGRFQVFDAAGGAVALSGVSALSLGVAGHRSVKSLAVATTAGTIVMLFAMAATTGRPIPYALPALLLGLVTWWLGDRRQWRSLRWFAGLALDLLLLGLIARAVAAPPRESPLVVLAVLTVLMAVTLGAFAVKTLRGHAISLFEAAQSGVLLSIGAGGAVAIAGVSSTTAPVVVGLSAVVLAGLAYAAPLLAGSRHRGDAVEAYFSTLGLALLVFGIVQLLENPARTWVLVSVAIALAVVNRRRPSAVWLLHATVASIAVVFASGLPVLAVRAWLPALASWPDVGLSWAAGATAVVVLAISRDASGTPSTLARTTRLVLSALAAASLLTAWLVIVGRRLWPGELAAAHVATFRTTMMALAAIALAAAGRWGRRFATEARWLSYAALVAGGLKLAAEDAWVAGPGAMFVDLAVYGIALIVAPRLARS
jgi:hypothetical protein